MTKDGKTTEILDIADELLAQGRHGEAIAVLEELETALSGEEQVLLRLAWASWDHGDKERSIRYWETILDRELQRKVFTGFAYDELVRIYKQESQIEKLVTLCEKATGVQPLDIGLLEELGGAYLLAGQNEKACGIFRKLVSMDGDNPAFHCRLGEALMAAGKPLQCEEAFRQAGLIDPDEAVRYLFLLADLYGKRGNYPAAKHWLGKCLEADPANSLYLCAMGDILIALEQFHDALASYEKAVQCDTIRAAVYYNRLGHSFMKAGHFLRAVSAFEKAVAIDENGPCMLGLNAARKELESTHQKNSTGLKENN